MQYLALKLSRVGWVVRKSDFNENSVVSPDLDLDFGLRLRVSQLNMLLEKMYNLNENIGIYLGTPLKKNQSFYFGIQSII